MNDPIEITNHISKVSPIALLATKKYFLLAAIIMGGAISHAIEDTRKSGWKGLGWFAANTFVAAFVGMLFSHIASVISPDLIYAAGGVGGFMGPIAFKYVRNAALLRLGLETKKEKD